MQIDVGPLGKNDREMSIGETNMKKSNIYIEYKYELVKDRLEHERNMAAPSCQTYHSLENSLAYIMAPCSSNRGHISGAVIT